MPSNSSVSPSSLEDKLNISGKYIPSDWLTEEPPAHEFCVDPLIPLESITLLNAHGGTGKSLFALKMAVHIVLGLPIIGASTNGGKVAYMSLEDSEAVVRTRVYKIVNSLPCEDRQDELTKKLMIIDRYGLQTHMAINNKGDIETAPIAKDLGELLKLHEIECLFVDTLIRTNALSENDNVQMGALLVAFEGIAKTAKCGVVLIHHLPKGNENKAYAARGASAITDNARSSMLLEKVSDKDVDKFKGDNFKSAIVDGRLIRLEHTKHNHSAKYPVQYLEITKEGSMLEVYPEFDDVPFIEYRYLELYDWWDKIWKRKPLTKTNIEESIDDIKASKSKSGRRKYIEALDWGIKIGCVKEVSAPEGGSKNSKAIYYTLFPNITDKDG